MTRVAVVTSLRKISGELIDKFPSIPEIIHCWVCLSMARYSSILHYCLAYALQLWSANKPLKASFTSYPTRNFWLMFISTTSMVRSLLFVLNRPSSVWTHFLMILALCVPRKRCTTLSSYAVPWYLDQYLGHDIVSSLLLCFWIAPRAAQVVKQIFVHTTRTSTVDWQIVFCVCLRAPWPDIHELSVKYPLCLLFMSQECVFPAHWWASLRPWLVALLPFTVKWHFSYSFRGAHF